MKTKPQEAAHNDVKTGSGDNKQTEDKLNLPKTASTKRKVDASKNDDQSEKSDKKNTLSMLDKVGKKREQKNSGKAAVKESSNDNKKKSDKRVSSERRRGGDSSTKSGSKDSSPKTDRRSHDRNESINAHKKGHRASASKTGKDGDRKEHTNDKSRPSRREEGRSRSSRRHRSRSTSQKRESVTHAQRKRHRDDDKCDHVSIGRGDRKSKKVKKSSQDEVRSVTSPVVRIKHLHGDSSDVESDDRKDGMKTTDEKSNPDIGHSTTIPVLATGNGDNIVESQKKGTNSGRGDLLLKDDTNLITNQHPSGKLYGLDILNILLPKFSTSFQCNTQSDWADVKTKLVKVEYKDDIVTSNLRDLHVGMLKKRRKEWRRFIRKCDVKSKIKSQYAEKRTSKNKRASTDKKSTVADTIIAASDRSKASAGKNTTVELARSSPNEKVCTVTEEKSEAKKKIVDNKETEATDKSKKSNSKESKVAKKAGTSFGEVIIVTGKRKSPTGKKNAIKENSSAICTKSAVVDDPSVITDTKNPVSGTECLDIKVKSAVTDTTSVTPDTKSDTSDMNDTKSVVTDTKSSDAKTRSMAADAENKDTDKTSASTDTNSAFTDAKNADTSKKSAITDSNSDVNDAKPRRRRLKIKRPVLSQSDDSRHSGKDTDNPPTIKDTSFKAPKIGEPALETPKIGEPVVKTPKNTEPAVKTPKIGEPAVKIEKHTSVRKQMEARVAALRKKAAAAKSKTAVEENDSERLVTLDSHQEESVSTISADVIGEKKSSDVRRVHVKDQVVASSSGGARIQDGDQEQTIIKRRVISSEIPSLNIDFTGFQMKPLSKAKDIKPVKKQTNDTSPSVEEIQVTIGSQKPQKQSDGLKSHDTSTTTQSDTVSEKIDISVNQDRQPAIPSPEKTSTTEAVAHIPLPVFKPRSLAGHWSKISSASKSKLNDSNGSQINVTKEQSNINDDSSSSNDNISNQKGEKLPEVEENSLSRRHSGENKKVTKESLDAKQASHRGGQKRSRPPTSSSSSSDSSSPDRDRKSSGECDTSSSGSGTSARRGQKVSSKVSQRFRSPSPSSLGSGTVDKHSKHRKSASRHRQSDDEERSPKRRPQRKQRKKTTKNKASSDDDKHGTKSESQSEEAARRKRRKRRKMKWEDSSSSDSSSSDDDEGDGAPRSIPDQYRTASNSRRSREARRSSASTKSPALRSRVSRPSRSPTSPRRSTRRRSRSASPVVRRRQSTTGVTPRMSRRDDVTDSRKGFWSSRREGGGGGGSSSVLASPQTPSSATGAYNQGQMAGRRLSVGGDYRNHQYQQHQHSPATPVSSRPATSGRSHSMGGCQLCRSRTHLYLSEQCPARATRPHTDVTAFKGRQSVMSNFYPCRLQVFGHSFASSEHAYQYMKCIRCNRPEIAEQVLQTGDGLAVKRLVKVVATDAQWEAQRQSVMYEIITAKARDVSEYRRALEMSRDVIAEAVPFDQYWSAGMLEQDLIVVKKECWPGSNHMGKLHMRLRRQLFGR